MYFLYLIQEDAASLFLAWDWWQDSYYIEVESGIDTIVCNWILTTYTSLLGIRVLYTCWNFAMHMGILFYFGGFGFGVFRYKIVRAMLVLDV
jgi:hypothetical protein